MSYIAWPKFLFFDDRSHNNKSKRNEMDHSINLTKELKNCTSFNNEVEMSETIALTILKSFGESIICNSKN